MKNTLVFLFAYFTVFLSFAQNPCSSAAFDLGTDTTLNCAENYTIHAPVGFDSYQWGTGETIDSISVSQSGTYNCTANLLGTNVVINGDFSSGNTGFQSDYVVGTGGSWGQLSLEGTYAVTSNSNNVHTNFASCFDHTSGNSSGSMMAINGSSVANIEIWRQTINVQPNTEYQFSTWGMTVTPDNPGQLKFSINGTQVGNMMQLSSTLCNWQEFHTTWNSGSATTAVIAIVNLQTATSGNDFAIDDIAFQPICSYQDSIMVTMPPFPQITVSPTQTICSGDTIDITAQSTSAITNYSWNAGTYAGATISVHPMTQETYTVVGTDDNGCNSQPEDVVVNVNPLPVITMQGQDTVCAETQTVIHAQSSIPNSSFDWKYNHSSSNSLVITPSASSDYVLQITSPLGCAQTDTFHITTFGPLDVTISGDTVLCDGDQSILHATSNLSNTQFVWQPSNMNANVLQVTTSDTGWVYLKGTQPECGTKIDSVRITIGQSPVITAPQNDTLCLGDAVTVSATSDVPGAIITWMPSGAKGDKQTLSPQMTAQYYVQANDGNCYSEIDSFLIVVHQLCDLKVPNVFTPNGDGTNDYFHLIQSEGIKTLNCVIINRWGNQVNEFNIPGFQWDGENRQGNKVDDGVYFYKIKATLANGRELTKSGYVHLIK